MIMKRIAEIKAEDTYEIRLAELRKGVSLSHKMKGDQESSTLHLGLFHNEELRCIGSFMRANHQAFKGMQYQLRGMATKKPAQGKGYGKELLREAENKLKASKVEILWCNARIGALDFYKVQGYTVWGEPFEVPEIGVHYVMYKNL